MECKAVEDLMSQYVENDVNAETKKIISRHIKQCSACKQLKEKIEELMYALPELEEEVPFFLKNRLLYLPESQSAQRNQAPIFKWVAAMIGTMVLFLNLFYFTNLYPPANKVLHTLVANIERIAVQTEAFFDRFKEADQHPSFADQKNVTSSPIQKTRGDFKHNYKNNGGHNG